ncbi:hypothetical protein HMPREF2797_08910 [Neisseria sp. HMSC061E12]|nr:hypothetical protein HMPREF2797_08910 [Neisseria sp. HMSC061E12]OFP77078.1 hypothetical protein HMPREF2972_05420 [Neisseria sp. HMSC066B07]OHO82696.1 hypothetical protein HMPREF2567_09690 [Neisseria sp. HMSC056A04]OHQ25621.1 hypothetical protein HMPREF2669_08895 [Neisseria sp. HMSC066F04]OHR16085.1 hypothetical protein HMPREF2560_04070 [Neisseria sp. HMSC078H04]
MGTLEGKCALQRHDIIFCYLKNPFFIIQLYFLIKITEVWHEKDVTFSIINGGISNSGCSDRLGRIKL